MDPFKHIVLLMLENHSFDQMLGCMQAVYPDLDGVPDGGSPRSNKDAAGTPYFQLPVGALQMRPDPKHEHPNVISQLRGGNAGFITDYVGSYGEKATEAAREQIMAYFPLGALPGLHTLAGQFTVCDHWFSSLPGPTWPNRFFALSGTSQGRVKMPAGGHDLGMLWNQTQTTLFDRLDEKGRSWKVYFYDFPASLILRHQRRPANLQRYARMDRFFVDAAKPADGFPEFVFLEPKYFGLDQNDDHPPHNIMKAQKLIADVYNAIRSNDALWKSTLLVVVYDEHGGFHDHVVPPRTIPPDSHQEEYTFDQLGVRVPALLVSPWLDAKVASCTLEHTSLLRYLRDKWALGSLGARTEQANSIAEAFALRATPREDTIPFIRVSTSQLVSPEPEWEQQDVSTHHDALHLVADVLNLPDNASEDAVAATARGAEVFETASMRARAALGDALIAVGRSLRAPLAHAHERRVTKTEEAVARRIPK